MAILSAISAFTDYQLTATDTYKLLPTRAELATIANSAQQVCGTTYSFGTSGYNSYYVNFRDYAPTVAESDAHAKIITMPAYLVTNLTLDGSLVANYKAFANTTTKYKYTGSTEESEYGAMLIMCRYARFLHLGGNVAWDYQYDYADWSQVTPIMTIDTSVLQTSFEDKFLASTFSQSQIMWLTEYVEQNLTEEVARTIMLNPTTVGKRLNTPNELHTPIKVMVTKAAGSPIIAFNQYDYLAQTSESPVKRRIGRLVFDLDLII